MCAFGNHFHAQNFLRIYSDRAQIHFSLKYFKTIDHICTLIHQAQLHMRTTVYFTCIYDFVN